MKLIREIGQVLKLNLGNLFCFEVLYRLVTIPVYLEAVNRGLKAALRFSRYSYVTAGNLGLFLIQPFSLLILFGLAALGLFFLMVELGGLLCGFQGCAYLRKVSPGEMLLGGFKSLFDEAKKRNTLLLPVVAGDFLLMNLVLVFLFLSHVKPVNFIVYELFHTRFGKPAAVLLVVALCLWLLPRTFLPQFSMIEQKSYRDSRFCSRRLVRRRILSFLPLFVLGNGLLALLMILLYVLCVSGSAVAVSLFVKRGLQLAVLTSASARLVIAVLMLMSVLSSIANVGLVTILYYRSAEGSNQAMLWDIPGQMFGKNSRRKLALSGAVAVLISGFFLFDLAYNGARVGTDALLETQITAHRGSSKRAPENTMSAFQAAVEDLADFAELDVQESKDGVLVVYHDLNLKRLTGRDQNVRDLTFAELEQIDLGGQFHFSTDYTGEKIPDLESVMEYAKGRINLNIELKNIGSSTELPERVAALIQEKGMEEQCVVTSVKLNYLSRIRAANPDIRTGYIVAAAYGDYYDNPDLDFISIRSSFVTKAFVDRVHEAGKAVHAWTVDTKSEVEQMKQAGVDNVITDYPVRAREVCYSEDSVVTLLESIRLMLR